MQTVDTSLGSRRHSGRCWVVEMRVRLEKFNEMLVTFKVFKLQTVKHVFPPLNESIACQNRDTELKCAAAASEFLAELMELAQPENLEDGPAGDMIADQGNRTANILKGSQACTSLIRVKSAYNCSCDEPVLTHEVFEMPPKTVEEKYTVCFASGNDTQFFGFTDEENLPKPQRHGQPDGIWVHINGTCQLEEFCGGFDGYWSKNSTDEHEIGLANATRQMLGVDDDIEGNESAP